MRALSCLLQQLPRRSASTADADLLLRTLRKAPADAEPLPYEERILVESAWQSYRQGDVVPLEGAQASAQRSVSVREASGWDAVAARSAHDELGQMEVAIRRQMLAGLRRLLTGRRSNVHRYPDLEPPTWTLHDGSWQLIFRCSRQEREIVVLRARQLRSAAMTV